MKPHSNMKKFYVTETHELSAIPSMDKRSWWQKLIDWIRDVKFVPEYSLTLKLYSDEDLLFLPPASIIMLENAQTLYVMARAKNSLVCRTLAWIKEDDLHFFSNFKGTAVCTIIPFPEQHTKS